MPYGTHTYHDRGSWKKTLEEKAMFFEENTAERHNILGSYPSSVRLIPPKHYAGSQEGAWQQIIETGELPSGWTFDHGTTGLSNVAHTSSWAQGVGEFSHLRYRGGPSHHNYDHVFRGLGIYYFVAADDAQKEKVCEIVADMSFWAHLRNNMVAMHADGERISTELIGGWRAMAGDDRPSGGSVM
ncbi:MAG: hypothetical protein QGG64_17405, partial [Candidatus Latescibacteria bacterium]|nr:hypothetical protein [Candidatus Latescibacterota bacterium]